MEYTVPKCRNCHQAFSLREGKISRIPLLLRCGHYFCGDCIEHLARLQVQDMKGVSCPECTVHTPLTYSQEVQTQLVPNVYLLGLLTAATLGLKRMFNANPLCMGVEQPVSIKPDLNIAPSAEQEMCEECEFKPATLRCLQCVGPYCDNCFKTAHAVSKSMCRHTSVPVTQVRYQAKQCPGHPEEIAKLYCEDDQISVCSECCRVGEHVGHSVLSFVEVAERHFMELRGLVSTSVNTIERLNNIEQALWVRLSEVKKDLCVKSADMSTVFTSLFVQLQRREQQLLEEVIKASDSCTSQLVDNIRQVHERTGSLAAMVSTVQSAIASGSAEVVVRGSQWSSELSRLCDEIPWELSKLELQPVIFKIDKKSARKLLMEIGHIEYTPQLFLQDTENPLVPSIPTLPVPRPFPLGQNEHDVLSSSLTSAEGVSPPQTTVKLHAGGQAVSHPQTTVKLGQAVSHPQTTVKLHAEGQAVSLPQTILSASTCDIRFSTPPQSSHNTPPPQSSLHVAGCRTPPKNSPQATAHDSTPPSQTGSQCEMGQQMTPFRPSPSPSPAKSASVSWDSAEPVTVIHVVDPSEFYVQRPGDQKALQDLTVKLDEYCPSQKHPHLRSLSHGEVFASKNGDGHWYRAKLDRIIKGASQVSVFVMYIDLGCSGMTTRDGLTKLSPELASGQCLCSKCSLADVSPVPKFHNVAPKSWTQQCLSQFRSLVLDNHDIRMNVICTDGGVLYVDLLLPPAHTPVSVIGRLTRMGHIVSKRKSKGRAQYPPCASLRPGEEVEVVISSTDSPSSFYVQLVDGYHSVTELCNQLQVEVATIQPSRLVDGTIGTVCLAVYSSDGLYYRAEIIAVTEKRAEVFFIDYGNKDIVSMETLLTLPPHYMDTPVQAIQCMLSDVISLDSKGTWSDEVSDMFSDMISKSVHLLVVEGKGSPLPVTLKDTQSLQSVSKALENLGLARCRPPVCAPQSLTVPSSSLIVTTTTSPSQAITPSSPRINSSSPSPLPQVPSPLPPTPSSLLRVPSPLPLVPTSSLQDSSYSSGASISPPILPAPGDHFTATVTHIASLLDFHVVMDTQQLEQLKFALMLQTPLTPYHTSLHPGDYCLAHFTDQELWYRVRVEALVGEGLCVVQYVDYGNVATISAQDTAPLPLECARLPSQAIPCRLADVGGASGWDPAVGGASPAVHLFSSLVMDQVVTVTVKDCDVMLGVSLTIEDGGDVVAMMTKHGFQL